MKTLLFLSFSLMLLFACNNTSSNNLPNETPPVDLISVKDTISLKKFTKWRGQWEKNGEAFLDTAALFKYFTLPTVDLTQVLAENVESTKYYFGLEKISKDKYYLKYMLVGTDKKGNDLIDFANGNYIYDKSKTCPPFCSEGD